MDTESPRVGEDARAGKSIAADLHGSSGIAPKTQHQRFAVIVSRGLWKGCDVIVEPPTATCPLRHFRSHAEALIFAEQLASLQGWRLLDRVGADG